MQRTLLDFERPWRDAELLRHAYCDRGLSQEQIAEMWGCSTATISNWCDRHGIDTGPKTGRPREKRAAFFTMTSRDQPYEVWTDHRERLVRVHRLVAVAEYGLDAVKGKEVHHKNRIPWDNRPGNLKLLSPEEHARKHGKSRELDFKQDGSFA